MCIRDRYQGFLGTDSEKLRLMRSLGATRGQILWMLVFPASFPTPVSYTHLVHALGKNDLI